jgi:hypothetical protein
MSASRSFTLAGDDGKVVVTAFGYEHPNETTGSDANWLMGAVEAEVGTSGNFSASIGVSLRTDELRDFRNELEELVERLDGEVQLAHLEDQLGAINRLTRGRGTMTAFVRVHARAELAIELPTDQSYLQETLRELDELVRRFPVRGRPQ